MRWRQFVVFRGNWGVSGEEVAPMWLEGRLAEIVAYNECDTLSTYLIWLRMAYFGGFLITSNILKNRSVSGICSV